MNERFSDLIILLASGINQRKMYFDDHPKVKAACDDYLRRLNEYFAWSEEAAFEFGVFGGKFVQNGKYLVGPSIAGRSLIEFAEKLRCGGFEFTPGLTASEVTTFFRLGAGLKAKLGSLDDARAMFVTHGIPRIRLRSGFHEEEGEGGEGGEGDGPVAESPSVFLTEDFAPLLDIYQSLYEAVAGNNVAVMKDEALDLDGARSGGRKLVQATESGAMDVMQFLKYPDYDSYTIGHSVRVAALAACLARELGWSRELQEEIATAGLVHDVGKGRVPPEILFKEGKLDDEERRIVESHPTAGAEILVASGERSPFLVSAAWGHHIREDRGGYPAVPRWYRKGDAAALIQVCDVFEALTAVRPYKSPMPPRLAFEIMLGDKDAFRPGMLSVLIRSLGLYPPGSELLLSDGRTAVVVAKGETPDAPRVRVIREADGKAVPREDQPALDLTADCGLEIEEFLMVGLNSSPETEPAPVPC